MVQDYQVIQIFDVYLLFKYFSKLRAISPYLTGCDEVGVSRLIFCPRLELLYSWLVILSFAVMAILDQKELQSQISRFDPPLKGITSGVALLGEWPKSGLVSQLCHSSLIP